MAPEAFAGGDAIQTYNRDTSAWRPLKIDSANILLQTNSSGNVGIGTTTPTALLGIGNLNSLSVLDQIETGGAVYANGYRTRKGSGVAGSGTNLSNIDWTGAVANLYIDTVNLGAISVSSDARVKKNIAPLATSTGLDVINALNPVTFNWLYPASGTTTQYGFIAQDVESPTRPRLKYRDDFHINTRWPLAS